MKNICHICKHEFNKRTQEPCLSCEHKGDVKKMKECISCKHMTVGGNKMPCFICIHRPKDEKDMFEEIEVKEKKQEIDIQMLENKVNEILDEAKEMRFSFKDSAVNWADLSVTDILYSLKHNYYAVEIEEANPINPELQSFITDKLSIAGYTNIDIIFNW